MNDANVRYYLEREMAEIKKKIRMKESNIEGSRRHIDDMTKQLKNLKIHYTSLLNTAIAYGHEVEEDEQDNPTA